MLGVSFKLEFIFPYEDIGALGDTGLGPGIGSEVDTGLGPGIGSEVDAIFCLLKRWTNPLRGNADAFLENSDSPVLKLLVRGLYSSEGAWNQSLEDIG